MTRGRKKDLTIPPTRALVQQRDYRARKANYVAELEERCRRAEEENADLRSELALAKAGLAVPAVLFSPQTSEASTELMRNLSLASASLARFQKLAFAEPHFAAAESSSSNGTFQEINSTLRPASFPSPAPSPPSGLQASFPFGRSSGRKRLYREESPPSDTPRESFQLSSSLPPISRPPSTVSSDCCGGILDCTDLVENEERMDATELSSSMMRLSGVRSTSNTDSPSIAHQNSP